MRQAWIFRRTTAAIALVAALSIFGISTVNGQSQAINAQIEGVVTDPNGAAVPSATVTARNLGTGAERTVTTEANGSYRLPLLPLGTYRVKIEATGFRRLVREGITLTTGSIATVNAQLEAGGLEETVTITSDAPIADPGKIDVGRVMHAERKLTAAIDAAALASARLASRTSRPIRRAIQAWRSPTCAWL